MQGDALADDNLACLIASIVSHEGTKVITFQGRFELHDCLIGEVRDDACHFAAYFKISRAVGLFGGDFIRLPSPPDVFDLNFVARSNC